MGLDHYLYKDIYVGGNYEHRMIAGQINIYKGDQKINVELKKISSIRELVCQWRKCNAIHGWFCNKVQKEYDEELENCKEYYIDPKYLQELLDIIKELLEKKDPEEAEEKLPVTRGFFFGNYEYDDWYWSDLEDTKEELEQLDLTPENCREISFIYKAWW